MPKLSSNPNPTGPRQELDKWLEQLFRANQIYSTKLSKEFRLPIAFTIRDAQRLIKENYSEEIHALFVKASGHGKVKLFNISLPATQLWDYLNTRTWLNRLVRNGILKKSEPEQTTRVFYYFADLKITKEVELEFRELVEVGEERKVLLKSPKRSQEVAQGKTVIGSFLANPTPPTFGREDLTDEEVERAVKEMNERICLLEKKEKEKLNGKPKG
jgi:hypothetical protein